MEHTPSSGDILEPSRVDHSGASGWGNLQGLMSHSPSGEGAEQKEKHR